MNDVLGDGTVSYNLSTNSLTFENAVIEHDYVIVYSLVDLRINLIGENNVGLYENYGFELMKEALISNTMVAHHSIVRNYREEKENHV